MPSTEFRGRTIEVSPLTEGQLILLARYANRVASDGLDGRAKINEISKVMSILESAIVDAADREFLETEMAMGRLELSDMIEIVKPVEAPANRAGRRATRTAKR